MKYPFIIMYSSVASGLIPVFPGMLFRKWNVGGMRLLVWLSILSFCTDVLVTFVLLENKINSWSVANLFFLAQFIFLFLILGENRSTILLRILFYACVAFGVINFFFLETPQKLNSNSGYVYGITMIISALNTLYLLMRDKSTERIQSSPLFWLAFGVLAYYGGNLFLFLFNNYLIAHALNIHKNAWVIHNLLNITKNIFFFAALWTNYKSKTSPL